MKLKPLTGVHWSLTPVGLDALEPGTQPESGASSHTHTHLMRGCHHTVSFIYACLHVHLHTTRGHQIPMGLQLEMTVIHHVAAGD